MRQEIVVLWLKRDLRWHDHAALQASVASAKRISCKIFAFCSIEPLLIHDKHYDERHWSFVCDSIKDMNATSFGHVHLIQADVVPFLAKLSKSYSISELYSHEETGIQKTYDRDKQVAKWCRKQGISWKEFQTNGVVRGRKNRNTWVRDWHEYMDKPLIQPTEEKELFVQNDRITELLGVDPKFQQNHPQYQKGGIIEAHNLLKSFLEGRINRYMKSISKPEQSRTGCSRLSPHIAWGNISIRQIFAAMNAHYRNGDHFQFQNFGSRLRWHCHFIRV